MNADFWKRFISNRAVQGATRRLVILAVIIPGGMLLVLKSQLHPAIRLGVTLVLIGVFLVMLKRANNAMNAHRSSMDENEDRRRAIIGKLPRRRFRWLKKIFPFFT